MERPWHKRALELEAESGDYADFHAWCEWILSKVDGETSFLDRLHIYEQIDLYAAFCECFDFNQSPMQTEW